MARNKNSDFIDIPALIAQYRSKWYWFVISIIVCGLLGAAYAYIKQPEYAVRANLLISIQKNPIEQKMSAMADIFGTDASVEDEVFVVKSHSLYRDVTKKLGINIAYYVRMGILRNVLTYPEVPLTVTPQAGMLDTLATSIRFRIDLETDGKAKIKAWIRRSKVAQVKDVTLPYNLDTPLGQFTFATTASYNPEEDLTEKIFVSGYDNAAEILDEDVAVDIAAKRSNVITLGLNTTNPRWGEAVLNEILDLYNQRGIDEKRRQGMATESFLNDRIELIAAELDNAERLVQDYKQKHGLADIGVELKYQTEKRALVEEKLLEAQTQLEVIDLTRQFVRNPDNAYSMIPILIDNESLQEQIGGYNGMIMNRIRLSESAQGDNIMLKRVNEQIDLTRSNIAASIDRALKSQEVAVRDLRRELTSAQGTLSDIPENEREFITLRRQQSIKNQIYTFLLQRHEENQLMMANAVPKGILIDRAYTLSTPLGLTKKMIILLALILGCFMPPVILYLRKLVHNRFETRADVERITDVPILGEMCIDSSGNNIVVNADSTASSAELFRLMRSNLLFILNDPNDKVVMVTSSSSGEGKSFISINLAASLTLLGKRVILVGMDIRKPRLAEYLGISPRFGLTQYLSSSQISLSQIIDHMPGMSDLDVICAGPVPPNPAELLLSEKVDALFAELRSAYDYIIVDTAPIGLVSDTFTLDRIADASIYVCRANYTSVSDLQLVNEIYEQHRLKKISLVLNGTAAKKSYGYGHKK